MKIPRGLALVLADGIAPAVSRWAEHQESSILRKGMPLPPHELAFARGLGIRHPEGVRVLEIHRIPTPAPAWLADLAERIGLPFFQPSGMALGRGIHLLPGHRSSLRHELVHVMQYERAGGIRPFIHRYLVECMTAGYLHAPLEKRRGREAADFTLHHKVYLLSGHGTMRYHLILLACAAMTPCLPAAEKPSADARKLAGLELSRSRGKISGYGDRHPAMLRLERDIQRMGKTNPGIQDKAYRTLLEENRRRVEAEHAAAVRDGLGDQHPGYLESLRQLEKINERIRKLAE